MAKASCQLLPESAEEELLYLTHQVDARSILVSENEDYIDAGLGLFISKEAFLNSSNGKNSVY